MNNIIKIVCILLIVILLFCLSKDIKKINFRENLSNIDINLPTGPTEKNNKGYYNLSGNWSVFGSGPTIILEQSGSSITTGNDCKGCFGKGTGSFVNKTSIEFSWEKYPDLKGIGELIVSDGMVNKINWKLEKGGENKVFTGYWLRKGPPKPTYKVPDSFKKSPGCCRKGGDWSAGKNIGMLMVNECAEACKKDPECYSFDMWNNIQPGQCNLYPKGYVPSIINDGGGQCSSNVDCFVKEGQVETENDSLLNTKLHPAGSDKEHWGKDYAYQYKPKEIGGKVKQNYGESKIAGGDPVKILKSSLGGPNKGPSYVPVPTQDVPSIEKFTDESINKKINSWIQGRTPSHMIDGFDIYNR
tara:strand:- start:385 stop:1455 length:1071 start_codon:yes stop_codon:yes gene_type:complete